MASINYGAQLQVWEDISTNTSKTVSESSKLDRESKRLRDAKASVQWHEANKQNIDLLLDRATADALEVTTQLNQVNAEIDDSQTTIELLQDQNMPYNVHERKLDKYNRQRERMFAAIKLSFPNELLDFANSTTAKKNVQLSREQIKVFDKLVKPYELDIHYDECPSIHEMFAVLRKTTRFDQERYESLSTEYAKLNSQLKRENDAAELWERHARDQQAKRVDAKKELQAMLATNAELEEMNDESRSEVDRLKRKLQKAQEEVKRLQEETRKPKQTSPSINEIQAVQKLEKKNASLRDRIEDLEAELEEAKASQVEQSQSSDARIEELEVELKAEKASSERLIKDYAHEVAEGFGNTVLSESKLVKLRASLKSSEDTVNDLRPKLQRVRQERQSARDKVAELLSEKDAFFAQMATLISKILKQCFPSEYGSPDWQQTDLALLGGIIPVEQCKFQSDFPKDWQLDSPGSNSLMAANYFTAYNNAALSMSNQFAALLLTALGKATKLETVGRGELVANIQAVETNIIQDKNWLSRVDPNLSSLEEIELSSLFALLCDQFEQAKGSGLGIAWTSCLLTQLIFKYEFRIERVLQLTASNDEKNLDEFPLLQALGYARLNIAARFLIRTAKDRKLEDEPPADNADAEQNEAAEVDYVELNADDFEFFEAPWTQSDTAELNLRDTDFQDSRLRDGIIDDSSLCSLNMPEFIRAVCIEDNEAWYAAEDVVSVREGLTFHTWVKSPDRDWILTDSNPVSVEYHDDRNLSLQWKLGSEVLTVRCTVDSQLCHFLRDVIERDVAAAVHTKMEPQYAQLGMGTSDMVVQAQARTKRAREDLQRLLEM